MVFIFYVLSIKINGGFVRNFLRVIAIVLFSLSAWSFEKSENDKYTVSFNYQLNLTNPAGDIPITVINFSISPSLIRDQMHEFGGTLGYSVNKTENTLTSTTSETSSTTISGFYRYITPMGEPNSKYPLSRYVGAQAGTTSSSGGGTQSGLTKGVQFGINMMVSQNLAINFHLLQWDDLPGNSTAMFSQSIGVKYYF